MSFPKSLIQQFEITTNQPGFVMVTQKYHVYLLLKLPNSFIIYEAISRRAVYNISKKNILLQTLQSTMHSGKYFGTSHSVFSVFHKPLAVECNTAESIWFARIYLHNFLRRNFMLRKLFIYTFRLIQFKKYWRWGDYRRVLEEKSVSKHMHLWIFQNSRIWKQRYHYSG
jgi:hypothetical protein